MGFGELIGGQELVDLIRMFKPEEKHDPSHVGISVDPRYVPTKSTDTTVGDSLRAIKQDLDSKAQHVAAFVSIRVHIGLQVMRLRGDKDVIDLTIAPPQFGEWYEAEDARLGLKLRPQEFVLCRSLEYVSLPANVLAFIQTRTTVAMSGIDVTPTNLIVPGFKGLLFLEIRNLTNKTIEIPRFFPVAEIFFGRTTQEFSGESHALRDAEQGLDRQAGKRFVEEVAFPFFDSLYELFVTAITVGAGYWLFSSCEGIESEHWRLLVLMAVVALWFLAYRYLTKHSRKVRVLNVLFRRQQGEES